MMKEKFFLLLLLWIPNFIFAYQSTIVDLNHLPVSLYHDVILINNADHPGFKSPSLDDSEWKQVLIPNNWKINTFPSYNGVIWYRLHIEIPNTFLKHSLGINLGYISDLDETYFNGTLIGKTGNFTKDSDYAYAIERIYEIPNYLIQTGDNVIAIRVKSHFPKEAGLIRGNFKIDLFSNLIHTSETHRIPIIVLIAVYFTIGISFFILFILIPRKPEFLTFSLFIWIFALFSLSRLFLPVNFLFFKKTEYILLFSLFAIALEWILLLLKYKQKNPLLIGYFLTVIFGIFYVVVTPEPRDWNFINLYFIQYTWLVPIGFSFYLLIKHRSKSIAGGILFSLFPLTGTIICDVLALRNLFPVDYISKIDLLSYYGFLFFIFSASFFMIKELITLQSQQKKGQNELNQKYKHLLSIIKQHDKDYAFATFLFSPLVANFIKSSNLSIDTYVNQKKKFEVQGNKNQIGSTLCFSSNLTLLDENYCFVVTAKNNHDSLQGALGSLIFGWILKALIHQTNTITKQQNRSPVRWLTDVYHSLQKTFLLFEEEVIISATVGLIHKIKGKFYYFNADHLRPVLYQNGEASFIHKNSPINQAIGIKQQGTPKIQHTNLQNQDIIVLATTDKHKQDSFPEKVASAQGNTLGIALSLNQYQEYQESEDFNIVTIQYKQNLFDDMDNIIVDIYEEDEENTQNESDKNIKNKFKKLLEQKKQAILNYNDKKYQECISTLLPIVDKFNRSREKHLNYKILGMAYYQLRDYKQSLLYWQYALKEKPDDEELKKYISILKEKSKE